MATEKPVHGEKFLRISRSLDSMGPLTRAVYDVIRAARRDRGAYLSNIQKDEENSTKLSFFVPSMSCYIHIYQHPYKDFWDVNKVCYYSVVINNTEIAVHGSSVLEMQIDKFLALFDKQIKTYHSTEYNNAVQSLNQLVQRSRQSRIR